MSDLDVIKSKLSKLLRLGECAAASQGEIDNAFRIAAEMMARHNLTRADVDMSAVDPLARMSFAQHWSFSKNVAITICEVKLAHFAAKFVGTVRWYRQERMPVKRNGLLVGDGRKATGLAFYGPSDDAKMASDLFDELRDAAYLLAGMKYGNWSRGNGAQYAEGFADGIATANAVAQRQLAAGDSATASLMLTVVKNQSAIVVRSNEWLAREQGIRLVPGRPFRSHDDTGAKSKGYRDGTNYNVDKPGTAGGRLM